MNDAPLLFALLHGGRVLEQKLEAAFAEHGLTLARFGVLEELGRDGPLALSDLAARQSCVRSNMTQLVDKLEADGLVRRLADPHDRRSTRAELTDAGRDRLVAGRATLDTALRTFDDAIARTDAAALSRVLSAVDDLILR